MARPGDVMKEKNNHMQGRSGSGTKMNKGPAYGGSTRGNKLRGGGINRALKGKR